MEILSSIKIKNGDKEAKIHFCLLTEESEKQQMFSLRKKIYTERGYIPEGADDFDDYDSNKSTKYFAAVVDKNIIGSVRVIYGDFLPTEKFFSFKKPLEVSGFSKNQKAELSRLVVEPFKFGATYLPRGLLLLFILKVIVEKFEEENVVGGYAFIKESLRKKMSSRGMPLHFLSDFELLYPETGVMYNYFSQKDDPVTPIYYLTNEFSAYIQKIISSPLFKHVETGEYLLRRRLYNLYTKLSRFV